MATRPQGLPEMKFTSEPSGGISNRQFERVRPAAPRQQSWPLLANRARARVGGGGLSESFFCLGVRKVAMLWSLVTQVKKPGPSSGEVRIRVPTFFMFFLFWLGNPPAKKVGKSF